MTDEAKPNLHVFKRPEKSYSLDEEQRDCLRDHFAMAALTGLCASDAFHGALYQQSPAAAAQFAYATADAMMTLRATPNPPSQETEG